MSYGERSNDHFLIYYGTAFHHSSTSGRNVSRFRLLNHPTYPTKGDYVVPKSGRDECKSLYHGFIPPKNPHDDAIVFSDIEHAISWHLVMHPELWDGPGGEAGGSFRASTGPASNRPISVYLLGEMPIQSWGQSVSVPRWKVGASLNAQRIFGQSASAQREKRYTEIGLSPPAPPRVCTCIRPEVTRQAILLQCLFSSTLLRGSGSRGSGRSAGGGEGRAWRISLATS
jgi:hypothetical protein